MAITKSTPAPLTGGTLWCVTIALSLATFMQMLDSTISNVAIPTISGFLGASTDEGTWVIIKELSTRKKNICSGIMVNDRDYRSDMWADIGRLYLR